MSPRKRPAKKAKNELGAAANSPPNSDTTRTLILHPVPADRHRGGRDPDARLAEAVGLAQAIALMVVHAECVRVKRPRPATLFGLGMVERFEEFAAAHEIALVVVDGALSPVQQRNLERAWKTKVIDRTALILEIFGARARTREGRLQVELAHLSYQRSRLVRTWTHLERQRGGFGFLGGPGDQQIEMDRRLIDERIGRLKELLAAVARTRGLHRTNRRRVPHAVLALVGYTNAGKSTLFNRLTAADVAAADRLFATLDPTMRAIALPSGRTAILSDTVGFISDLPTDLIAAFRATLEEVLEADLILHVRDAAHADAQAQKADVEVVLATLGLSERAEGALIEVLNKLDLLVDGARTAVLNQAARSNRRVVAVSARTGEGCEGLIEAIDERLGEAGDLYELSVALVDGRSIAWLYDHGEVVSRRDDDGFAHLRVRLGVAERARFAHRTAAATSR